MMHNIFKKAMGFLSSPNTRMRSMLLCAWMMGVATWGVAQVVVKMQMDTTHILVGEQVQMRAKVLVDKGKSVVFPHYAYRDTMVRGVEVLGCGSVDTMVAGNGRSWELTRRYTLTSFDSALYALPPIAVEVDGRTYRSATGLGLKVSWMPVDTLHPEVFFDPHTVVPQTYVMNTKWGLSALWSWGALLVAIVVGVVLTRGKPLVRKKIVRPRITPNKEATTALNKLNEMVQRDVMAVDDKMFYVTLTEILRMYLERRFAMSALQQTSDELMADASQHLNEPQLVALRELLQKSDEVKFAKGHVAGFERERHRKTVEQLLAETYDEEMEHPRPEVIVVTLNDGMQKGFRRLLWLILVVAMVWTVYHTLHSLTQTCDIYL